MNFLTVSFSDEDRARIDRLAAALEVLAGSAFQVAMDARPTEAAAPDPAPAVEAPASDPAPAAEAPASDPAAHPVEDPFPAPAESAPAPISLADFQKQLTLACAASADMKASVRALINEYAPAASSVPEDKRAEVLARLAAL